MSGPGEIDQGTIVRFLCTFCGAHFDAFIPQTRRSKTGEMESTTMHDSNTQPIEHYHTIVPGSPAITGNDGASTSAPTVTGNFTLYDSAMYQCVPSPGYDDIHNGTQVQVEDSTGKVLGIGHLDQGASTGAGSCTWNFTVPDVPMQGSIFKIEVSHRGAIAYSKQNLLNGDVHLTLGSLAE